LTFVNVKLLIMLKLFLEQARDPRATYMILSGDLVPAGTTLVTLDQGLSAALYITLEWTHTHSLF